MNIRRKTIPRFSAIVLVVLTFVLLTRLTPTASAQTFTATLTGTVTDQNEAVVPNVQVVATNQGTKLEYTAQTAESGVYTIPFLPIGNYVISIEAQGFKKLLSNELKLEVNQTARVDLTLQVGELTQQVIVEDVAQFFKRNQPPWAR